MGIYSGRVTYKRRLLSESYSGGLYWGEHIVEEGGGGLIIGVRRLSRMIKFKQKVTGKVKHALNDILMIPQASTGW